MSTIQEHEQQALQAFQSNVEDLAKAELDRLELHRAQLEESLTIIRSAIKAVKATLAATLPKQSRNGSKPAGKKKAAAFVPSPAAESQFRGWLEIQGDDDDLTAKMLDGDSTWSSSYCNQLFKWGRENGLLRQAGQVGSKKLYRKL